MAAEQGGSLGLDRLRQQRSRAIAQNLRQRIRQSSWLGELKNVSVGRGVSLLQWRSGGSNPPTIRRLTPSCPSPTFAHSSSSDPECEINIIAAAKQAAVIVRILYSPSTRKRQLRQ